MQTQRPRLIPGPNHPIALERTHGRVIVRLGERVIADTYQAFEMRECDYEPVLYVPRSDVNMELLERTTHSTYCPYKGEASHFSIPIGGERSLNAVWTYESPYEAVAEIKEHVAFYPDRVDAIIISDSDRTS